MVCGKWQDQDPPVRVLAIDLEDSPGEVLESRERFTRPAAKPVEFDETLSRST